MKKLLTLIALLMPISIFALGLINDFEWLEPNNRVEVVVGEPYQLKFNCSNNSLPFTSDYADSWVHYDFEGGQHVVSSPTFYNLLRHLLHPLSSRTLPLACLLRLMPSLPQMPHCLKKKTAFS